MITCRYNRKIKCGGFKTGKGKWCFDTDCLQCPVMHSARQTYFMEGGELRMVKIADLPKQRPRRDLKDLPMENELLAMREKRTEAQEGRPEALIITFMDREGYEISQKYTAFHGLDLVEALKKLGYTSTEMLKKTWHKYKLHPFSTGYPRYMPTEKLEKAK